MNDVIQSRLKDIMSIKRQTSGRTDQTDPTKITQRVRVNIQN